MIVYIINNIKDIDFIDESKFQNVFDLSESIYIWKHIYWWVLNISKQEFVDKLPLLNGFVNKYWFINEVILPIDSNLIELQNIYEIVFEQEKIEQIPDKVREIKAFLESWKLLTNSKKQEFKQILYDSIYLILQNIIKLYFIVFEAVKNKQELKKMINSENILAEYKAQANLLETTSTINIEKMINQLDFLIKHINIVSEFYKKFLDNYVD